MKIQHIILLSLTLSILLAGCSTQEIDPRVEALASCLKDSGALFYGAYWCGHCENQKEMFGASVKSLPYVECTQEQQRCAQANIEGYPTWVFADGTRQTGVQSFEALAEISGCEY